MHHALFVPPFGELADPSLLVDLACAAEDAGWDGFFLWDHMWRPEGRPVEVSDAWICMAAIATSTTRLRIGPMVTPLARRRPQKVARESVALDHLSNGRLILGVGLGVNTGGELERFGEQVDERTRGDMLDEALALLLELWSGATVTFRGAHFMADGVRFLPTPLQEPRIPVWVAARGGSTARPIRRASRFDGLFPVGASIDQLARMLHTVEEERGSLDGFDVAVIEESEPDIEAMARRGVTWLVRSIGEGQTARHARDVIESGPA